MVMERRKSALVDSAHIALQIGEHRRARAFAWLMKRGATAAVTYVENMMVQKDLPSLPFILNILESAEEPVDLSNTALCCQIVLPDYEDIQPAPPTPPPSPATVGTGWNSWGSWSRASTAEVQGRSTSSVEAKTEALVKSRARKSDVDKQSLAAAAPVVLMEKDSEAEARVIPEQVLYSFFNYRVSLECGSS